MEELSRMEQQMEILQAIGEVTIHMRAPGDWYASQNADVKIPYFLAGGAGNGESPEEAVDALYRMNALLEGTEGAICVAVDNHEGRKYYKWNGFMWKGLSKDYVASIEKSIS